MPPPLTRLARRDNHEFAFRYRGRLLQVDRSKVRVEATDTVVYSLISRW